ncbi:hypothetical protein BDR07DRAFT_1612247 [Suillus spraguei]|nr:hypothetical protein BDR07DRAFT_1612247 [Suillus spraguei]
MNRVGPSVWRRFSSTSSSPVFVAKPAPSKARHHVQIPDTSFPYGYSLTGVHCGVKKNPSVLDLTVILSTSSKPASAAVCFTRNAFKAAPVLVCQDVLEKSAGRAHAIVTNSGCANAVTGKQGLEDAWAMVKATDTLLPKKIKSEAGEDVHGTFVMSTGVIGQNLPIAKILSGISSLVPSSLGSDFAAWERAAKAFMTTDTFPKLRARTFSLGGQTFRMAGMDKGAGMIHPNMGPPTNPAQLHATLLGCILTDAAVSPKALQSALTYAVDRSFNSISVDGEMSTNDTIVVLANGAAAGEAKEIEEHDPLFPAFREELTSFAAELAQLVVRDGEGATKFVTVSVEGAPTFTDAHRVASKISTSALVKTALYGEDANWGRILAATGSVPLSTPIDPYRVNVTFVPADGSTPLPVLVRGEPELVDEVRAKEILSEEDFEIKVDLGLGGESAQYWTCDFSYEYVRINGDYRS